MSNCLKRKLDAEENEITDDSSTSQIILTTPIIATDDLQNCDFIVENERSIADQKKRDNKYNWPGEQGEVFKIETIFSL